MVITIPIDVHFGDRTYRDAIQIRMEVSSSILDHKAFVSVDRAEIESNNIFNYLKKEDLAGFLRRMADIVEAEEGKD